MNANLIIITAIGHSRPTPSQTACVTIIGTSNPCNGHPEARRRQMSWRHSKTTSSKKVL